MKKLLFHCVYSFQFCMKGLTLFASLELENVILPFWKSRALKLHEDGESGYSGTIAAENPHSTRICRIDFNSRLPKADFAFAQRVRCTRHDSCDASVFLVPFFSASNPIASSGWIDFVWLSAGNANANNTVVSSRELQLAQVPDAGRTRTKRISPWQRHSRREDVNPRSVNTSKFP